MAEPPGPDELCRLPLPTGSWIGVRATEPAGGSEEGRDGEEGRRGGDKGATNSVPVQVGVRSDAGDPDLLVPLNFSGRLKRPQNSFS